VVPAGIAYAEGNPSLDSSAADHEHERQHP
jgi:hypothetical protein